MKDPTRKHVHTSAHFAPDGVEVHLIIVAVCTPSAFVSLVDCLSSELAGELSDNVMLKRTLPAVSFPFPFSCLDYDIFEVP